MRLFVEKYMNGATYAAGGETGAGPTSAPAASEAPAAAPAAAEPSATPASGGGEDIFSAFSADGFDSVEIPEPASEPGPAPAEAPPTPAPAPAAPATPAEPAAAEPVVAAPTPPDSKDVSVDPSNPQTILQGMASNAPALQEWMAQNLFKLTKEEQDAFELDAVGQIPKLMAKAHFESSRNAINLIQNLVPAIVEQIVQRTSARTTKSQEALNEFYSAHPTLNAKDHAAAVDKWAKAFRATNPKASRKEAIDFVGRAVMNELGVAPAAAASPRSAPFAPARQGVRQVTTQQEVNPFEGLGSDHEE